MGDHLPEKVIVCGSAKNLSLSEVWRMHGEGDEAPIWNATGSQRRNVIEDCEWDACQRRSCAGTWYQSALMTSPVFRGELHDKEDGSMAYHIPQNHD